LLEPDDEFEVDEPVFDVVAERTGWLVADELGLEEVDAPEVAESRDVDTWELVADTAGTAAAKPAVTAAPRPSAE